MKETPIVHGEPIIFELGGSIFKARPLPLEVSFAGLDILQTSIAPLIAEASEVFGEQIEFDENGQPRKDAAGEIVKTFGLKPGKTEADQQKLLVKAFALTGTLPKLTRIFAEHCDVQIGGAGYISCAQSTTVFARRTGLAFAWLVKCLEIQYSDFLDGTGVSMIVQTVKALLAPLGLGLKSG
jgi:hypothetical protein